jgi:hypothetical protein
MRAVRADGTSFFFFFAVFNSDSSQVHVASARSKLPMLTQLKQMYALSLSVTLFVMCSSSLPLLLLLLPACATLSAFQGLRLRCDRFQGPLAPRHRLHGR